MAIDLQTTAAGTSSLIRREGGQVLVSDDKFNDYKYGTRKVYEATPWDRKYRMGEKRVFSSLAEAKKYAKSKMG